MKKYKWFITMVLIGIISAVLVACQTNEDDAAEETETDNQETNTDATSDETYEGEPPVVTMTMEDGGEVAIELYPDVAPNTVNNFIALIEDGFYDGLIFHRVIPGFMIQGGDPDGNGTGGPGHAIKGEFSGNGFENNLSHDRGVLSMARSQHPDSAGSQFFITVDDRPDLDGQYATFGKVIDGMDIVDDIVSVDRDGEDLPDEEQVIESMTVELHEYEPADVEKE